MQSSTYRTLLIQRQGQGFSEAEATAVLQQVLLQLSQLHLQGKEHGAISLDTLAVTNGQVTLIPANSAQFQGSPAKDIYDLGMAMIELLTAKSLQVLFNANSNQTWDDYCLVSDQFLEVINRMVGLSSQPRFTSATEVLPVLNIAVPATATTYLQNATVISPPVEQKQTKKEVFKKVPKWVWGLGISGGVITVLLALILPNLLGQVNKGREARARMYVGVTINRSQIDNYLKTGEFAASLSELKLSLAEESQTYYEYRIYFGSPDHSIVAAIPRENGLRGFVGIVSVNSNSIDSYLCQGDEPSKEPPQIQGMTVGNFSCPPGFSYLGSSTPTAVSQESSSTSSNSTSSRSSNLTQSEAVALVQGWYDSKPQIFGPAYNQSLVDQYATGKLYYDTTKSGGSVDWLRRNGCYYSYGFSKIENVWLFDDSGIRPYLKVKIHENLRLNGPQSAGCGSGSKTYHANVTYWFEKDNGVWKISEYNVED